MHSQSAYFVWYYTTVMWFVSTYRGAPVVVQELTANEEILGTAIASTQYLQLHYSVTQFQVTQQVSFSLTLI